MQLTHESNRFSKTTFPVVLICDQITSPANVGSIFRLSDAFGVAKIVFCGGVLPDFSKRMQKTSRSTENYVKFEFKTQIETALAELKKEGYVILALEITDTSIPLPEIKIKANQKVALILGAENFGIGESVLEMADTITHIPMYGVNSSMNVAQAATIALYEITNQLQLQ